MFSRVIRARDRRRSGAEGGFTLIELMIVVSIMFVLAAMAVPNLRAIIPRYRLNTAARDLAGVVQQARMMAIAHGREYRIRLVTYDSAPTTTDPTSSVGLYYLDALDSTDGNWDTLPVDPIGDTVATEGTFQLTPGAPGSLVGISIVGWTPMGGPDSGNTDCIVFSPQGWIKNPTTDFDGGFIYVQFRNKYANPNSEIRTVRISRGGAVSILQGAAGTL